MIGLWWGDLMTSLREFAAQDFRHLVRKSDDVRIGEIVRAVFHLADLARIGGNGHAALAVVADRLVVVEVEFPALLARFPLVDVRNDRRRAIDHEDVRAQIEDLFGHVVVQAVHEAHDGDHGHHADHHAQQRQHAAHFVRPKARRGDLYRLAQRH